MITIATQIVAIGGNADLKATANIMDCTHGESL